MNFNLKSISTPAFIEIPKVSQANRDFLLSPTVLILGGLLLTVAILNKTDGSQKGKLATSYWGGDREIAKATKKAFKQIRTPTRNSASLYINGDRWVRKKNKQEWKKRKWKYPQSTNTKNIKTFYIPDVQRGTAVIGAAGTGKTFSVIDPMIRSTLDQGFPLVLYDFKYPAQTKRAAAYAAARGYKVRIFAPGFNETYTCNPLDFLRDEEDAVAAGQLAQTINRNLNSDGAKSGDKFFEQAGDSLVEGIFLLTKAVPKLLAQKDPDQFANKDGTPNTLAKSFCDLMTSQSILALDNIAERLFQSQARGDIAAWTSIPLSQVIATRDSEKTVASIVSTAITVFQRFLKKDFIGSFCGDTSLDLDVDGKQLIVFGLDRNNRDIVSPLLAAILHMMVSRNVSRVEPRKDPLVVSLDELPTLFLPNLTNWLNENREDGFCGILGFQNMNQLEKRYGKEIAKTIVGGCANKGIFNPQENESAEVFAKMLGEQEIGYSTKSRSRSAGKGGNSTSTSDQKQKRYLLEPAEFLKLGTGRCVFLNPNYVRGDEGYVPIIQNMQIAQSEIDQMNWSVDSWDGLKNKLCKFNKNPLVGADNIDEQLKEMLEMRKVLAEKLFPLAPAAAETFPL